MVWISVERTDSENTGERDAQASVRVWSCLERCKMKTMDRTRKRLEAGG